MRPDWPVPVPVTGVRLSLWRAATAYRVATLVAGSYLIVRWRHLYAHAAVAFGAGAGMVAVTAVVGWLAVRGRAHHPTVVGADVVATTTLTLLTIWAQTPHQRHGNMPTLTTLWAAGPALEAGIVFGAVGGAIAGLLQLGAAVVVRAGWDGRTVGSGLLLVVAGGVVGYVASLVRTAENELRVAATERAAVAERDRLARSIHDGVLQVLGLVQRAGQDATGHWSELAAEAGRQEAALRALVTSPAATPAGGVTDVAQLLRRTSAGRATMSGPAGPVPVPTGVAQHVAAAVGAALHNVAQHAGSAAHAWILLERLPTEMRVTVRDDGVGMPAERLAAASAQGRLGVDSSIRGRIAELGGRVLIESAPGRGTVVVLTIPMEAEA
jgi:signal transduction histidine kinase